VLNVNELMPNQADAYMLWSLVLGEYIVCISSGGIKLRFT